MNTTTAAAVLRAEESGDRAEFSFGTFPGIGPGHARRGWHRLRVAGQREWVAASWPEAVAAATQAMADATAANDRDAEIASAVASGASCVDVAAMHGRTPARVGQIARKAGVETKAGRKPTGAATHHTARGRALLAQLVTDAAAAGVEPEEYLAAARRSVE